MNYVDIANKWRAEQSESWYSTGVVLIWNGEVYGWTHILLEPRKEQPGAIAVDHEGHVFRAEGGDDYNGAKRWVTI